MSTGVNARNTYWIGTLVRVSWTYKNSSGTLIDPTAVLLWIRGPDGALLQFTHGVGTVIVSGSTGNYYADISAELIGTYTVRAFATGTGQAAIETGFDVVSRIY